MNTYSYLCCFLAEHPEDWEAVLIKKYGVKVKKEDTYAIFNYSFGCDYSDPIVQESRGIILDTEKLEVVCWPFRKFGNHNESYADPIDWSHARVLEKVDGSIMKLWFDRKKHDWQFSTNGTIRAEKAPVGDFAVLTYDAVIRRADNFADIPFAELNPDYTYIFELVSPDTQIVVPYKTTRLYHTGTRSNLTGQEMDVDIGIRKPEAYPIHSLSACVEAAVKLNQASDGIAAEGFVVVDRNWNRVKIKSPDYILRHHLMQMKSITRRECIQLLLDASEEIDIICQTNPELVPVFKFYDYHLARVQHLADKLGVLAKQLYEEYSRDRSAVAKVLQKHPLAWIGFRCIGSDKKGREYLMQLPFERLCKLIPEYQEEDLRCLFLQEEK